MQFEQLRIYHEHQSSQLCARHCLNNLLQGPYFTEFDLSKIALDLDKEEQALLAQDGDENNGLIEWLKHNQSSQNVSDDGNFSIQVLRRALDNLGLKIYHFGHKEVSSAQEHPENETGFICNLQAHWFAIRRIGGVWYDLNSLSGLPETKAIPTTISNFYLSAYLSTLSNSGYSIFVVRSDKWPHLHSYDPHQLLPPYAKWRLANDIKPRSDTYPKELLQQVNKSKNGQHVTSMGWGGNGVNNNYNNNNNNNGGGMGGMSQDEMLQYAIQQSVNDAHNNMNYGGGAMGGTGGIGGLQNEDPELAHALELSMKAHNDGNNGNNNNNNNNGDNGNNTMNVDDEDAMLQQALAMSMQDDGSNNNNDGNDDNNDDNDDNMDDSNKKEEDDDDTKLEIVEEPDESDPDCCFIQLRISGNKRMERRFKKQHLLNDVANFVKMQDSSFKDIVFVCPPMNSYDDMDISLETICKQLNSKKLSFIVKENENKDNQ